VAPAFRNAPLITLTEPHTALRSGDTVRITPEAPFFSTPPAPASSEETAMSQFVTLKEDIFAEAVDGVVSASGGRLARLDGYPHIRVVLRADWDKSRVALVSCGGSGHEPAHAGFVGAGIPTAAICGDVFASPSVDAVLAGILAVTGPAGCLLIIKNDTGVRLNFGFAAECAWAFGLDVAMVVADDDIALPSLPQARGVAGTLFVNKIVGALAENGADRTAPPRPDARPASMPISSGGRSTRAPRRWPDRSRASQHGRRTAPGMRRPCGRAAQPEARPGSGRHFSKSWTCLCPPSPGAGSGMGWAKPSSPMTFSISDSSSPRKVASKARRRL